MKEHILNALQSHYAFHIWYQSCIIWIVLGSLAAAGIGAGVTLAALATQRTRAKRVAGSLLGAAAVVVGLIGLLIVPDSLQKKDGISDLWVNSDSHDGLTFNTINTGLEQLAFILSKPDYAVSTNKNRIIFTYTVPAEYTEGKPTGEVVLGKPVYTAATSTPSQYLEADIPREEVPELEATLRPVVALRTTPSAEVARN